MTEINGKKYQEVYIDEYTSEDDVVGKFAWNHHHNYGGIIHSVDERGASVGGTWNPTITGDCVYDSLTINGFKVYKEVN